ncbi:MAG: hypothetical protein KGJ81_06535 [Alphaproteobacteria bacterium]|nr:hypothetical protein [Alphaproteobacteria bacterium]MDE2351769.1 hypothetical protein [Alphaproteobacteria bacterium]
MTASLLARKGDAAPSLVAPAITLPRPALVTCEVQPAAPEPPPFPKTEQSDRLRRIVVSITQDELEKLGIAAIKKGISRHDIVRGALEEYFRKLAAELPQPCACMDGGACRC